MTGRCGKVPYRDKLAAKLALTRIVVRDNDARPKAEQRAYRCPTCRAWHLTSKERAA